MISRSEGAGLTVAVLGHVGLIGLLALGYATTEAESVKPNSDPIEVSISDEVGLESQAPVPSTEEAAALKAPEEGPPVPADTPPAEAPPEPAAKPQPPKPAPAPAIKPAPPAKPAPPSTSGRPQPRPDRKPSGALEGLDLGVTDKPSPSRNLNPPSPNPGPEQQSSMDTEIRRQLKRHWRAPTGADMDLLRTIVELRLNPDGSLAAEPKLVRQLGITPSNKPQADLHFEAAVRAIKLAAPFKNLPPEFYTYWRRTGPAFDRRLSQ